MDVESIGELIGAAELGDVPACRAELAGITRARSLLDAREVAVVNRLNELAAATPSIFPEGVVAAATRTSLRKAARPVARAKACELMPELSAALGKGDALGGQVDAVADALGSLEPADRSRLTQCDAVLARAAAQQTAEQFRRTVEHEVRRLRSDDGLARLERQRRETRLRTWTDPTTGMWHLAGQFDPATGAVLAGRLRNAVESLFHDRQPDTCPTDPVAKQQHLAALALIELIEGRGPRSGLPDVTVIIDADTLCTGAHDDSIVDVGAPFDLPVDTIRRWACIGTIAPVVVSTDGTRIHLGRETRLANRQQRRALRVLYRSCALCDTAFDHCQVHHVAWFRLGGCTDIDNLLPLCRHHHHLAHEGGWKLHLAADRTLTVTHPDGTETIHPPPSARPARCFAATARGHPSEVRRC